MLPCYPGSSKDLLLVAANVFSPPFSSLNLRVTCKKTMTTKPNECLSERRSFMSETSLPLFARRHPGGDQPEPIERLPGTSPGGCRLFQPTEPSRISSCREPRKDVK